MHFVTEDTLDAFRANQLSATAILEQIKTNVWVSYRLAVGVGKSRAADVLLGAAETYEAFDLVVFAAPQWSILDERLIVSGRGQSPVPYRILRPRPTKLCGDLDEEWRAHEARGRSTYAKASLCRICPQRLAASPCAWPDWWNDLDGVRLVLGTEKQLLNNRSLIPMLRSRTGAERVLLVLDEASLIDASFEVAIDPGDLRRFLDLLDSVQIQRKGWGRIAAAWRRSIEDLIALDDSGLRGGRFEFPTQLGFEAFRLQEAGIGQFGQDFRYLGFDLPLLQWSQPGERWKSSDGVVRFVARPYMRCHVLLLSAHLNASYAGHRLGCGAIPSPFETTRFLHSGTRIFNLRSRLGAARHFLRNKKTILDAFAVLILRNVAEGRSTLLVSRKKWKKACASYLEDRLAKWGVSVRIVHEDYDTLPPNPDPRVIPLVHYGVRGVNSFEAYQSAYCLNSFYIPAGELNRIVQDAEPELFRVRLEIVTSGATRSRKVRLASTGARDRDHTALGNTYLERLEIDPVVQAVGRVRPFTKPRELTLFALHDMEPHVGDLQEVRSPGELLRALGLPTPREIDRATQSVLARRLMREGLSAEKVAGRLGVSRRTVFNRVREAEGANGPLSLSIRVFLHSLDPFGVPGVAS